MKEGERVGMIAETQTHDRRPTGKLYATRWKHEHLRSILIGIIIVFAVVVMFNSLLRDASAIDVTVVDNGKTANYRTWSGSVSEFLDEQGIHIGPYDQISLSPAAALNKNERIVIERAKRLWIQADGVQQVKYTTKQTIGEALADLNIPLGSLDRVIPPTDEPVREGANVRIVRVHVDKIETEHPIAFTVVKKHDRNLEEGKEKIVTTGKEGILVKTMERVFEDGKLVSERMLDETVVRPAVQQVVSVGSKKPVQMTLAKQLQSGATKESTLKLNGKAINVKHVLTNVTLTAYSAGPESTGKKPGDPGYGITASGTKVQEGRTIAVDPTVIPMGWWVYIEGIGFRRAEDTGSAIKGKKIDVYFDSDDYVKRFGKKRGYNVYVIGPAKPTAD